MEYTNLLNDKGHRFIPYVIISLNNLFSYAGESYEKWQFLHKKIDMKKILPKISYHGKRHFEVNYIFLFKNENMNCQISNNLLLIAEILIDIRNWLFHPEQNQDIKIRKICQKLNLKESSFFIVFWRIIGCFLYKNELIHFIQELCCIYEDEEFLEKNEFLKLNFYSFGDSFAASIKNIDAYSSMCKQTVDSLITKKRSIMLQKEWNEFLNLNYKYSNFVFDYDYFNKNLFVLTKENYIFLIISNIESTNLKKLKISKLFYHSVIDIQKITFQEFQSLDSGFITNKYKNLIKEIYKVLKIQKNFNEYRNILLEKWEKGNFFHPNSLEFIKKINLIEIRNQIFHFSYKKEIEQEIYSHFFYLIAHPGVEKPKIEKNFSKKLNEYLNNY